MRNTVLMALIVLFSISPVYADGSKATPEDVYELVVKAYEVVKALGEESFGAFNDPKGEFVYKDTYVFVQNCPSQMMAHPFAMEKLRGVDLNRFPFNEKLCAAGDSPEGRWVEYQWPKPGETEPSRKVSFVLKVEGTPYTVVAGIYNDTDKIEDLNKTLR